MTTSKVLDIVKGHSINAFIDSKVNGIKIDTRILNPGDVFIALQGKCCDGHDYIKEAIEKSASAIIVEKNINIDTDIPIILVDNTLNALHTLAYYNRKQYDIPVIAITGSTGKTTTKEIISHILSKKYKVLKNYGNHNNLIGVPMTLLSLDETYDYVVLELGMNHVGELKQLSNIVIPDICIITNIGTSHIGNFKNQKEILNAKLEILEGNKDSILIVNGEDKLLSKIDCEKCYLNEYDYVVPIKHLKIDYYLAIKICLILGLKYDEIISYLKDYQLYKQRMNIYNKNNITLIDDSYNASYESVVGGLDYVNSLYGDSYIILGDILELGKYSKSIHKKIDKYIDKCNFNEVLLIGDSTKYIKGTHFNSIDELKLYIDTIDLDDKVTFYVKGSRAMHLEEIAQYIKEKINGLQ